MQKTTATLAGKIVYVNPETGRIKVGARGKAVPVGEYYAAVSKGKARRLKKRLRQAGFVSLAARPARRSV